jgi:hypothetical protein
VLPAEALALGQVVLQQPDALISGLADGDLPGVLAGADVAEGVLQVVVGLRDRRVVGVVRGRAAPDLLAGHGVISGWWS